MMKHLKSIAMVVLFGALTASSCQVNEYGEVDLSAYQPENKEALVYNHPIALYTGEDFARVKKTLSEGNAPEPVKQEFAALKANKYTNGEYGVKVHTHQQIVRGDATGTIEGKENYMDAARDAAAAHQFGLLWQVTGDAQYAKKGVKILNEWARVCKEIKANDQNKVLAAGCQGFTFALAGEMLRDYEGWSESEFTEFANWMVKVFASENLLHLEEHGNWKCCPRGATHYWSNWDLVNLCSYFQIGVLTENDDMIKYVVEYFSNSGIGNGNINKLILGEAHLDPLGSGEYLMQNQESGRDQGHACMSALVAAQLCQAAWALYQGNAEHAELDFYALNDNAILKMVEFVALTNLRNGTDNANKEGTWLIEASKVPWTPVGPWCDGGDSHEASHQHVMFADDAGRGGARPGWEMVYQHYKAVGVKGFKYCEMFANKLRPECGSGDTGRYGDNSGAFDQLGWNTMMLYR